MPHLKWPLHFCALSVKGGDEGFDSAGWLETRVINKRNKIYTCEWRVWKRQRKPQWLGHSTAKKKKISHPLSGQQSKGSEQENKGERWQEAGFRAELAETQEKHLGLKEMEQRQGEKTCRFVPTAAWLTGALALANMEHVLT